MVAPLEATDERQTPVQWAPDEAVRGFILHSRAVQVGKGQPRSYDDPQRKGSCLYAVVVVIIVAGAPIVAGCIGLVKDGC